jgi:hypothetical protein
MKFISYFYEFYFIFYAFYKFIRISGLLKEIGKQKKKHRTATGRQFGPWPDVVGLAHGQGSLLALAARSPGGGHPTWRGCRRRLSGASDAGSAAREPGKTQGHAGRGGEGRFSPRRLVGGSAAEKRWRSSDGGTPAAGGDLLVDLRHGAAKGKVRRATTLAAAATALRGRASPNTDELGTT